MVNKVILVGRLGADPEIRYTPSGLAVTTIRLATNERWRDPERGEVQERTEWHRVVLFGRLAEIAGQYLRRGRQVYIEGSLRTRKWQDREGRERYTTEIVARDLQMLGSRSESETATIPSEPPRPAEKSSPPPPSNPDTLSDDFDDDIPF